MNIRQKYELKMLSEDGNMDMEKIAELFSIHLRFQLKQKDRNHDKPLTV